MAENENLPAKTREEQLLAMRAQGGTPESSSLVLPLLKLEHNLLAGEKNPNAGLFTLARKDGLGNWNKEVLGEEIVIHLLLQRYTLSFVDNDVSYGSPEFDDPNDIVRLWKTVGQGESRKSELFAEDTPAELARKFLITKNNRTMSQLKLLVVLYGELENKDKIELVKWSTNVSGTVGYRKYARKTTPFAVLTKVTKEEATSGSNKYFRPIFHVVSEMPDFDAVLKKQQEVIASVKLGSGDAIANVLGLAAAEDSEEE